MPDILMVDDERWVRTSLKKVIERSGLPFRVVQECSNGLEALDWLENHTVDVVMTDVKMPVMDGITMVRQLKERNLSPELVMVSGYDDFQFVQFALRAQVVDYLLKPVEVEDMGRCLASISERLAKAQAQALAAVPAEEPEETGPESPIQTAIRHIRSVLPGEVTLQDVAAKVHLNPSYLSQLFKQQMGINFVDYVLEQRMDKAKQLLSQTTLRISEIAERVGYSDIAYFSSTYKRVTGQTPSEFRKSRT
ncbi:response regulator transcription factor [Gorillibacterium sp. sgz5001074]|uniref:response regulator transcription factor n=1 Tax=Gorillibacterium sp. sgz5001074 TaxID=3446695 RepID=UPI003F6793E0